MIRTEGKMGKKRIVKGIRQGELEILEDGKRIRVAPGCVVEVDEK